MIQRATLWHLMLVLSLGAISAHALTLTGVQSRKVHLLGAGTFDIPVDTIQPMSGPVTVESRAIGGGHSVVFQFDGPITSTGILTVIDDAIAPVAGASAVISGNDVVVTIAGLADDKRVTISLDDVNGVGLNVSASLGYLVGDVNGSRSVTATDIVAVKARSGQATDAGNFKFDLNASGAVTASDILGVKGRSGMVLPTGNAAPVVGAGPNQTITLPATALLAGTASDDGLPNPPAALTLLWSRVSGPSTVTFGDAAAANTTASFGGSGAYVLRLTANDGQRSGSADVGITVNPDPATLVLALSSGNNQTGVQGTQLGNPLAVRVTDNLSNPVSGITVTWAAISGGPGVGASSPTSVTNASGIASVNATLGTTGGTNTFTATVSGVTGSPLTFSATAAKNIAINSGNAQTGAAGNTLASPLVVKVTDNAANPVAGITVTFAVATGGGSVGSASVVTSGGGLAQVDATLGSVGGSNTYTATVAGLTGSPVTFSATAANNIAVNSGNAQVGAAGSTLANPLRVKVTDNAANPIQNIVVNWAAVSGGPGVGVGQPTTVTDASGMATVTALLGTTGGSNTYTATVAGLTGSPVTFSATAAKNIAINFGNAQAGAAGSELANPLRVQVTDNAANPIEFIIVTFAVATGGGSVSSASALTDAFGTAQVYATLGSVGGSNTYTATVIGLTGSPLTFSATAAKAIAKTSGSSGDNQTGAPGTVLANPLSVTVTDNASIPVAGITVTWAAASGGGSVGGATSITNGIGVATQTATLGAAGGANTYTATVAGLTGSPLTFSATGGLNLCANPAVAGQSFSAAMQGCSGVATFNNRAATCGATAHVCNANEWVQQGGGLPPTHNYWTDDNLGFSSGGGTCGPGSACANLTCFAAPSGNPSYTLACPAGQPMRVCSATQPDPEGNNCVWTGCGFNSIQPAMSFGGCGGLPSAGTLCCANSQLHRYFVSASLGSDANPGTTSAAPFKTIGKAMTVAVNGDTVAVAPGTYDVANGETFPIAIPAGVNLVGDESSRGAAVATPTTIGGAVSAGAGSTVAGFSVTGTVTPSGPGATIRSNTLTGSPGIAISTSNVSVLLNTISNSATYGIYATAGSAKVENNTISGNAYGVVALAATVDLGGGAFSSVGNNILSCNSQTDLYVSATTANALNNRWDHTPPVVGSPGGADITLVSGAIAITTGASLTASPCPACSASAASTQTFDNTMVGCGAPGAPAAVSFANRATMCPSYCHACSASEWNAHRGATAPTSNYWTGSTINFVSGSSGSCTVSLTSGSSVCTGGSMLVCPIGGAGCQISNCGLDTTVSQLFGGCSTSSGPSAFSQAQGTLCCC